MHKSTWRHWNGLEALIAIGFADRMSIGIWAKFQGPLESEYLSAYPCYETSKPLTNIMPKSCVCNDVNSRSNSFNVPNSVN